MHIFNKLFPQRNKFLFYSIMSLHLDSDIGCTI